ncbi:MAG: 23S rRNA (pseudouridine(1915)-N(3))-methyltransferase RlmH [Firmicutes bacterium]|nr:23S rRNA (pseudouridine(1915)-N(3))-methyltransferase RlmH [Candidatus Caballimonas caccae]
MKINLVCVGKVKEEYFSEGINEYSKRLSRFCEFSLIEVSEENYQKVNESLIEEIKDIEGARIDQYLKGKIYCLAIEGKKLSSESFANLIKSHIDMGDGVITFVIGGSYGIADSIKKRAKLISFSDMTFPHTLFRLMFSEQLYRAFSIIAGSNYHK